MQLSNGVIGFGAWASLALALAGCGGGSNGAAGVDAGSLATAPAAQVQTTTTAPAGGAPDSPVPAGSTGGPSPEPAVTMSRPDVAVATADDIAAWNAACQTDACRIVLPPRSGRSLNWWGTDPRLIEQTNETCGPQPACRVPDGDLLVWNFACSPQPSCRIRLSRSY